MEAVILTASLALFSADDAPMTKIEPEGPQIAATCFKTGERTSGMNKICYYDCLGSTYAITVGAVELCPLSIRN